MAHQTRRGARLWILGGLLVFVCLMAGGRQLGRVLRHIVHDVLGSLHPQGREGGGMDLPVLAAIDEWGQAVAPLVLMALLWLLVDGRSAEPADEGSVSVR